MYSNYIITVSYGNYTTGSGGTDKVILTHQHMLNKQHYSVLHFCPLVNNRFKKFYWNMYIDGKFIGIFSSKRLLHKLFKISQKHVLTSMFIHHLKGIDLKELTGILSSIKCKIYFYLHDYYTVCPLNGLIYKKGDYCGSSFPSIEKCSEWCNYKLAISRSQEIKSFFDNFSDRICFVAPSDAAKNNWVKSFQKFEKKVLVIYHQEMNDLVKINRPLISVNDPLKIAFVGYQRDLKGWNEWKECLYSLMKIHCNCLFYQFGWGKDKLSNCKQVIVDFKDENNNMVKALKNEKIDCVVLWSKWPETYSYTYYESLAAECFIITNPISGNIADQVQKNSSGVIVNNLYEILSDEIKLRKLVNDYRSSFMDIPTELIENHSLFSLVKPNIVTQISFNRLTFDLSNFLSVLKKIKKIFKGE